MVTDLRNVMFKNLQLVVLGVVVLQAAGMSASENKSQISPKTPRTPRSPLSCSQQARRDSGDFPTVASLKRSLEKRKEEPNSSSYAYYPWPGGNPDYSNRPMSVADQMKPWVPHDFYGV
jgi:hypothetical protein